jgi:hypothetical protein
LAAFNTLSSGGTWTLIVRDAAGQDVGTVQQVTLSILGSQILRLTQGIEEGDETTSLATTEESAASAKLTPTPLAVWLGPVRGEPTADSTTRRGTVRRIAADSGAVSSVSESRLSAPAPLVFVTADERFCPHGVALADAIDF